MSDERRDGESEERDDDGGRADGDGRLDRDGGDGRERGDARVREYDKLVRDRIPEIVRENGEVPETHVATGEEYRRRLREKLEEEAAEYRESGDPAELADVLAVVAAICEAEGIDREALAARRCEKADRRGAFDEGIVLERVRSADGASSPVDEQSP
ncbi:nucleoside triphosphate pyrophosphohydrolase [Halegenticoccus tardaugens]|uniref:nucleoside triphosphate pyrophosphohydrolase n=1 Tax=Halegenticoccus tardaugens TaxID=2071624 RepID=UPI002B27A7E2|nr:nucleoside triphosphate pyrophosphohydrolase [Halegenticoccus tardaugens]